jgi:hypothetical protein
MGSPSRLRRYGETDFAHRALARLRRSFSEGGKLAREKFASEVWLANRSSFAVAVAHLRKATVGNLRGVFMSEGWCGSGDLNPDGLAPTSS